MFTDYGKGFLMHFIYYQFYRQSTTAETEVVSVWFIWMYWNKLKSRNNMSGVTLVLVLRLNVYSLSCPAPVAITLKLAGV